MKPVQCFSLFVILKLVPKCCLISYWQLLIEQIPTIKDIVGIISRFKTKINLSQKQETQVYVSQNMLFYVELQLVNLLLVDWQSYKPIRTSKVPNVVHTPLNKETYEKLSWNIQ